MHYRSSIIEQSGRKNEHHQMEDHDDMHNIAGLASIELSPKIESEALLTGFRGLGVHKSVLITNVTVNVCQKIAFLGMYISLPAIDFYRVMKKCLSNLSLKAI